MRWSEVRSRTLEILPGSTGQRALGAAVARGGRVALTVAWLVGTEAVVIALATAPVLVLWVLVQDRLGHRPILAALLVAATLVPAVFVFGMLLLPLSAGACRVMGWRTPRDARLPLSRLEWPLLRWGCYLASTHVASLLVGTWLRATPIWTWYLRANGARVGRGVYVNTLRMSDHNLLEFGDGVVIGSEVHLSGHIVERGHVLTGGVRVGAGAVVGMLSVVAIDVEIGAGTQIGALSLVPKHARLESGASYGGVPVRRLDTSPGSMRAPP